MRVTLSGHLGQVGLADLLGASAGHLGRDFATKGLVAGVISSDASLGDALLNVAVGQKLSFLDDLVGSNLELLTKWAVLSAAPLSGVRVDVLVGKVEDIELHPVDV